MQKTAKALFTKPYKSLFLLIVSTLSLSLSATASAASEPQPIPVRAIQLSDEKPKLYRSFAATSRAANRVSIRSQVNGRVLERFVNLGDQVMKGDVLARLYNPEATPAALAAKQEWEQTQVLVAQRKKDYARIKALYESDAAAKQEFENAQTNLNAAKAVQAAAQSQYQRAAQVNDEQLIRAPFDGMITQVAVEAGEVINAGQAIMQLADPHQVETEVTVSERIASSVKKGDLIKVTLPLQNPPLELVGRIEEITPFRERGALPTVVVRLPKQSIKPGITLQIHFAVEDNSQFALPISAVIKTGSYGSAVYRITANNKAQLVAVRPHQLINNLVTVSGDLTKLDRIVVAGTQNLFEGAPVYTIEQPKDTMISALEK